MHLNTSDPIKIGGRRGTIEIEHNYATMPYANHENTQYQETSMCKLYRFDEMSVVS